MSTTRDEREQAGVAVPVQAEAVDGRSAKRALKPGAGRTIRYYRRARGFQSIYQSTVSALRALRANALRSLLTSLGIIIGVGAVIIMIAISEGNSASINQRLSTLNPLQLTIRS